MKRVIFDVFLVAFIFLLPWWIVLILSIIGLFIFKSFYEFIVASIIIYLLYSVPLDTFFNKSIFVYAGIIIFYLIAEYLRRHIILYKNEIPHKT